MRDRSDLQAEYEPPTLRPAKFVKRLGVSEWTAVAAAAAANEKGISS